MMDETSLFQFVRALLTVLPFVFKLQNVGQKNKSDTAKAKKKLLKSDVCLDLLASGVVL